ncbi:MAG: class 1 fructose-bisphosphatase [Hyphomicrobiaceae bacterium]|nr:class 1 fructose-bisphosphatase [Hyphomicrobiaceae bacterium]
MAATSDLGPGARLAEVLDARARRAGRSTGAVATVLAIAEAATAIAGLVRRGPLPARLGASSGHFGMDDERAASLALVADEIMLSVLRTTPTGVYASDEYADAIRLRPDGSFAVAVSALEGAGNMDIGGALSSLFQVHAVAGGAEDACASFLRAPRDMLAAGYVLYGPHVAMAVTIGQGTDIFILDPDSGQFRLVADRVAIPVATRQFAINTSNVRHWYDPVRAFVDDCVAGLDGPRGKDFNMRWSASLAVEAHRILMKGGVYLSPGDRRAGLMRGRLRHVFEAAPIVKLVEEAGGLASDGQRSLFDKVPAGMDAPTPLFFGAAEEVQRIEAVSVEPLPVRDVSPLFRARGLFSE